jgi:hypothetical protein
MRGRVSETSEASATSALSQVLTFILKYFIIKFPLKFYCLKAFQRLVAHQRVDGAVSYFNPETG